MSTFMCPQPPPLLLPGLYRPPISLAGSQVLLALSPPPSGRMQCTPGLPKLPTISMHQANHVTVAAHPPPRHRIPFRNHTFCLRGNGSLFFLAGKRPKFLCTGCNTPVPTGPLSSSPVSAPVISLSPETCVLATLKILQTAQTS